MRSSADTLIELIVAILRRYCRQNQMVAPSDDALHSIAERLGALVDLRGVPIANRTSDETSAEMTADEVAPLVTIVLEGQPGADQLAIPIRQLVKACFQAERRTCRDSYRELTAGGVCRRQQLERVRSRVSGSHCVDCPYWNELDESAHAALLASAWCQNPEALADQRDIFLPADFRALCRLLRTRRA